jgi:hypothetical protein
MTNSSRATLEHTIGSDGIMSIRLRDGEIRLHAIDGDAVRVRETSGQDLAERFGIELGEGSLALTPINDRDRLGRRRGRASLDIDLPHRATVVIETVSGEVEADGLRGDQRYQTTSGDTVLRGVSGRVAIEAVSGDVNIVATGTVDVALRTVSGDIELRAATIEALSAATTNGDISVAGGFRGAGPFAIETVTGDGRLAAAGDLRVEMTTLSGDLRSKTDSRIEGGRGHRSMVIGRGGPLLTFRSMSGDLAVEEPRPVTGSPRSEQPRPGPGAAIEADDDDARVAILRALERGEIDVAEAGRRMVALDAMAPVDPTSETSRVPTAESIDD